MTREISKSSDLSIRPEGVHGEISKSQDLSIRPEVIDLVRHPRTGMHSAESGLRGVKKGCVQIGCRAFFLGPRLNNHLTTLLI
jgi:hypothetical protein